VHTSPLTLVSTIQILEKKLGRIPAGGGWRARGRAGTRQQRHKREPLGYDYLHSAVDDRTRLAYTEALPDETDPTSAAFLARAMAFFRDHGIDGSDDLVEVDLRDPARHTAVRTPRIGGAGSRRTASAAAGRRAAQSAVQSPMTSVRRLRRTASGSGTQASAIAWTAPRTVFGAA